MNLNMQKIWVRLVIVIASLMALGSAGVLWWVAREQQHTAIEQAEEFAQSVHQMTMAQLMFAKATRNYKRQGYYLEQVEQSRGLRHLKVLRGAATVQQFGEREQGVIPADDPLEKAVLADGKAPLLDAADLPSAVNEAARLAQKGDVVLMSPACASLDMFRNYVHRADVFIAAVRQLPGARG